MENSSIVDMKEALIELDCPICTETFSPPIYICTTGHSICSDCRSKVQDCPTCRTTYSNGRNYSLENMLNAAQRVCKYFGQGCKEILPGDLHNSHIKSCTYRDVECLCCNENGIKYNRFIQHLEVKHQKRFTLKPEFGSFCVQYNLAENQGSRKVWGIQCYKFKNDVVIFIQRELQAGVIYFTVWKYPDNTVGLICNMKLSIGQNFMASWKMKVNSFRNTFTENIKNGAVAAVPCGSVFSNAELNPANQKYSFIVTYEIEEE